MIPKLNFKFLSLQETSEMLSWFIKDNDSILPVNEWTLILYPELKEIKNNDSVEDLIKNKYDDFIKENNSVLEHYSNIWSEYNDNYMEALSNYLNIKWPSKYSNIQVRVGKIPLCPRYIKEGMFDIHLKNDDELVETCMHELCHFLFFEKCKELFKDWKWEDFESPSLLWYLSEITIDPILNSNDIQKVFKYNFRCYDIFYNIKIDNKLLVETITNIFNNNDITNAIILGYNYLKEHEEEFISKL